MAIQTEVTLQPDYTCCLRVMGENPALQKRTRLREFRIERRRVMFRSRRAAILADGGGGGI